MPDDIVGSALYSALPTKSRVISYLSQRNFVTGSRYTGERGGEGEGVMISSLRSDGHALSTNSKVD